MHPPVHKSEIAHAFLCDIEIWRNCASPSDVDWITLKKNTTDFPFCPKPFFPKSTLPFQKSCLGFFGWGPDDAALFPTLPPSESSGSPPLLSLVCKPGAMNFKRRLNSGRKSRAHLKAYIEALESCRSGFLKTRQKGLQNNSGPMLSMLY